MAISNYFFKYGLYYPITLFRGEFFWLHYRKLLKSQYVNPSIVKRCQLDALKKLICTAINNTNFYSKLGIDSSSIWEIDNIEEILAMFPVLSKDDVRNNFLQIINQIQA